MYPRWFTIYQFFKLNNTMPLDIFSSILQYYIYIKPDTKEDINDINLNGLFKLLHS
jgi:hypothetical protein